MHFAVFFYMHPHFFGLVSDVFLIDMTFIPPFSSFFVYVYPTKEGGKGKKGL